MPAVKTSEDLLQQLAQLNLLMLRFMAQCLPFASARPTSKQKRSGSNGVKRKRSVDSCESSDTSLAGLAHAAAAASNSYAHFLAVSAHQSSPHQSADQRPSAAASVASGQAHDRSAQHNRHPGSARQPAWVQALLDYCSAALLEGTAVPATEGLGSYGRPEKGGAELFAAALDALNLVLRCVRSC